MNRADTELDQAVSDWLVGTLPSVPAFSSSIEWMIVDEPRAAAWVWSHLPDPTGEEYSYDFSHLLVLRRERDEGGWDVAESIGRRDEVESVITDWWAAGGTTATEPDASLAPPMITHPDPPEPAPDRAVIEAVCDALTTENWLDLIETAGARWHDHGGATIQHWADGTRVERVRIVEGGRAVVVVDHHDERAAGRTDRPEETATTRAALVLNVNDAGRITYLDHLYDAAP